MLSEVSNIEKDRYYIISFICRNQKTKINEQTKQKQSHIYKEQTNGSQMAGGLEEWVKMLKELRSTLTLPITPM